MLIETQSLRALSLPSPALAAARTCAGELAFVCEGQRAGTQRVALFAPPTGLEEPGGEPERPRAMVQLPGVAPAHVLPNAHHEQLLVHQAHLGGRAEAASLTAIDVATASPLWRLQLEAVGPAPIVVGGRVIVVVDPLDQLLGCDLEGYERWSVALGSAVTAGPIEREDDPGFWVGAEDGRVCDFSADGELRGAWRLPAPVAGIAPGRPGVVYAHSGERLWRLDAGADAPVWETRLRGEVKPRFVVDPKGVSYLQRQRGGVARVAADGDRVEVMDGADGVGAPLLDFSGAVAIIAASTSGGELLTWAPSGASPEDLPEAQITTLDEPPLAMWSEPHALTLVSRAGTVIKLRCSL
ncbi:MAG: hypothetical protein CMH57_12350 [Myxococcales bacterium]|nr:hypothetical protein [Myxococcales bacterium]